MLGRRFFEGQSSARRAWRRRNGRIPNKLNKELTQLTQLEQRKRLMATVLTTRTHRHRSDSEEAQNAARVVVVHSWLEYALKHNANAQSPPPTPNVIWCVYGDVPSILAYHLLDTVQWSPGPRACCWAQGQCNKRPSCIPIFYPRLPLSSGASRSTTWLISEPALL